MAGLPCQASRGREKCLTETPGRVQGWCIARHLNQWFRRHSLPAASRVNTQLEYAVRPLPRDQKSIPSRPVQVSPPRKQKKVTEEDQDRRRAPSSRAKSNQSRGVTSAAEPPLPDGWATEPSRSKPGELAYTHLATGTRSGLGPSLGNQQESLDIAALRRRAPEVKQSSHGKKIMAPLERLRREAVRGATAEASSSARAHKRPGKSKNKSVDVHRQVL